VFQDAVDALVKAIDAQRAPPWLSYRALLDDISSLFGVSDLLTYAVQDLERRLEAVDPPAPAASLPAGRPIFHLVPTTERIPQ
jgi:hypothetical protein